MRAKLELNRNATANQAQIVIQRRCAGTRGTGLALWPIFLLR